MYEKNQIRIDLIANAMPVNQYNNNLIPNNSSEHNRCYKLLPVLDHLWSSSVTPETFFSVDEQVVPLKMRK